MRTASLTGWVALMFLGSMRLLPAAEGTSYRSGGLVVSHSATQEGMFYDTPADRVAYNVQIVKTADGDAPHFATIFHSEPRGKGLGKPGDSIRMGRAASPFSYTMPADCPYRLWGVQDDPTSLLFSPDVFDLPGWGGTGNPMTVKGPPGDDYYYVFFLAVGDDDNDRDVKESDYRHILLQARTKDFARMELRTHLDGAVCWRPFDNTVAKASRWPSPLFDVDGKRVCNRIGRKQGNTQGLIGSICRAGGVYHFFYTEIDADNKTYLFHRTCPNVATLKPAWSRAERVSDESLMEGTVIRVAKAPAAEKWLVLYNGYTDPERNHRLRQALFLQATETLAVVGRGGLSSLRYFARGIPGYGINDQYSLGLSSGNGVFAQHDFLTDAYGNATAPTHSPTGASGLVTWTAMTPSVYGSKVYWAEFTLRANAAGR